MAQAASEAMAGAQLLTGPVRVHLDFRPASRPASHYLPANRRRPVRELRLDAPSWYATTPDVDKLARAALDSLTGIVFEDDRQVAWLVSLAKWPSPDEVPGVTVTVSPLEATR
jgi:Holliday junction resolvase RusA-like endonuclease